MIIEKMLDATVRSSDGSHFPDGYMCLEWRDFDPAVVHAVIGAFKGGPGEDWTFGREQLDKGSRLLGDVKITVGNVYAAIHLYPGSGACTSVIVSRPALREFLDATYRSVPRSGESGVYLSDLDSEYAAICGE